MTAAGEYIELPRVARRSLAPAGPSLALRLRVRLTRARLDLELAEDADRARNPVHALRARQLASAAVRCDLACALDGMLDLAEEPGPVRARPAADVLAARPALRALATRLRGDRPAAVQGIARAALLVAPYCDVDPDRPSSRTRAAAALRAMG
jgi:hypothetical protein